MSKSSELNFSLPFLTQIAHTACDNIAGIGKELKHSEKEINASPAGNKCKKWWDSHVSLRNLCSY